MNLFWFQRKDGKRNFGDDLSQPICHFVTGCEIRHASRKTADIYGLGSLLQYFSSPGRARKVDLIRRLCWKKPLLIWGTGLLRDSAVSLPRCEVLALRGKRTAEKLHLRRDVPLGDPGLIVSDMIAGAPKSGKIGVIPHFTDKGNAHLDAVRGDDRFQLIDVEERWDVTARDIAGCSTILASSLHGLIVADSFEVPSHRIVFSDDSGAADHFKFNDYVSAFYDRGMDFTQITHKSSFEEAARKASDQGPRLSSGILRQIKDDLRAVLIESI